MINQQLPPVPLQAPIIQKSGILTQVWAEWFNKAFSRMGGHVARINDWEADHAASGFQLLPSGLLIQWGITGSLSSGTTNAITPPTPFPTACLQAFAAVRNNSASSTAATGHYGTGNYSATSFDLYNRTSLALTFNWFAIGH